MVLGMILATPQILFPMVTITGLKEMLKIGVISVDGYLTMWYI